MTQVIATVHKKPYYHDRNQRMIEAGVDIFRMKCSHFGVEDIEQHLKMCREQINASGRPVKLLADLPEAKIRLGVFHEEKIHVTAGSELTFTYADETPHTDQLIPVRFAGLGTKVQTGETFYAGDGTLAFEVTEILNADSFKARALNASRLIQCSPLTFPSFMDSLDHVTPFLDEILAVLPESRPEYVAFSFVNSKAMLARLIEKLMKHTSDHWRPIVIAKIESPSGVKNIDEILELAQGIMVARGDLALNVPFEELGLHQKRLVRKARAAGKFVIVSTGMLQSLLDNYLPMRSDILDVTNACLDGADAIMLCPETAHSETPERAVQVAKAIIGAVERSRE